MTSPIAAAQLPLMLDVDDLQDLMRCSRNTAYARTRRPEFPDPIAFSGSGHRWWRDEVLAWVEGCRVPKKAMPRRVVTKVPTVEASDVPVPRPVARRTKGVAP